MFKPCYDVISLESQDQAKRECVRNIYLDLDLDLDIRKVKKW
jgi:hypothetical protein